MTSLDSFSAKPFVPGTNASWKPPIEVLKKGDQVQKEPKSYKLLSSSSSINGTPTNWCSKRQANAETATYGSEFDAAKTPVDQIVDSRYTLMYLGVSIRSKSYFFGDNQSVVTSSKIPTSILSKRCHLASHHHVREAIAANYVPCIWKDGKTNAADISAKLGNLHKVGHCSSPCTSGEVKQMRQQKLGICKGLATSQAPALLER